MVLKIIHLDEIDSTNSYAKLNFDKFVDRTAISADTQTAGRGRYDRKWVDLGSGNLFLSVVLKPSNDLKQVYACIPQYLAVVLSNILRDYGISPSIKWPNDVLVNDAKIAGILCESVMRKNIFQGLVLGIGVNLNAQKDDFAKIHDKTATSLNIELGCEYVDKQIFTEKLLSAFFENYDEFLNKGFVYIKDEYIKSCKFLGKDICVKGFREEITGIAKDISDTGALVLENKGKDVVLTMGDISGG